MSTLTLSDQQAYFDGFKISNSLNSMSVDHTADAPDVTTFGSTGNREFVGGLKSVGFSMQGFYNGIETLDAALHSAIGTVDIPLTFFPENTSAIGDLAYLMQVLQAQYTINGGIGDPFGFSLSGNNNDSAGLIRGNIMLNDAAITATGNQTGVQVGAVTATQSVYASLHVYDVSGTSTPTLGIKIQSDDNAGFTTPTDRITFTDITAVGSEWMQIAGAITDDYWRVVVETVSGTTPSFGAIVSLGIK